MIYPQSYTVRKLSALPPPLISDEVEIRSKTIVNENLSSIYMYCFHRFKTFENPPVCFESLGSRYGYGNEVYKRTCKTDLYMYSPVCPHNTEKINDIMIEIQLCKCKQV